MDLSAVSAAPFYPNCLLANRLRESPSSRGLPLAYSKFFKIKIETFDQSYSVKVSVVAVTYSSHPGVFFARPLHTQKTQGQRSKLPAISESTNQRLAVSVTVSYIGRSLRTSLCQSTNQRLTDFINGFMIGRSISACNGRGRDKNRYEPVLQDQGPRDDKR